MPKYYPAFLAGCLPDWPTAMRFSGAEPGRTFAGEGQLFHAEIPCDDGTMVGRYIVLSSAPEGHVNVYCAFPDLIADSPEQARELGVCAVLDEVLSGAFENPPTLVVFEWRPLQRAAH